MRIKEWAMQNYLAIGEVIGLTAEEQKKLNDLQEVYNAHILKNQEKSKYYDGHISLQDVNLGIALPKGLQNFEIGCEWGAKTVDVLASRSMFDGFVGANGTEAEKIRKIADANRLVAQYKKACRDELKYGSAFATLSKDQNLGCRIRFHSPEDAAAIWNGEKNRIDCGLAIVDTRKDEADKTWRPSVVNLYTENAVITIRRTAYGDWVADRPFQMHISQPLMVPMSWNATMDKPFGRSRLKAPIRGLIQSFVRTMANMTIGNRQGAGHGQSLRLVQRGVPSGLPRDHRRTVRQHDRNEIQTVRRFHVHVDHKSGDRYDARIRPASAREHYAAH